MIEHNCEREENDIKTKLRPFGKEITKSMFPQERRRERERQGSCTLSASTRKKYNNCCCSLSLRLLLAVSSN
jgi:hypothetical protein